MQQMAMDVVSIFFNILEYAILIRCIISWFPIDRNNPLYQLIHNLTEPVLAPVRKMVYKSPIGASMNMIDFSPIISMLLLSGIQSVLIRLITSFM